MKYLRTLSPNLYGAVLLTLGAVLTVLSNSMVHMSMELSVFQMVFFKTTTSVLILVVFFRGRLAHILRTPVLPLHALKALCGVVGNFFWFAALIYLPLAQTAALSLSSALFTSIGGWFIFHERFHWTILLGLSLGFFGVSLILDPFSYAFSWAVVLPLASAFFFSGSSLLIKPIARHDKSQTTLLYLMGFMCVFSAIPAALTWKTPLLMDLFKMILIGGFYTLTQLTLIEAYSVADVSFLAPFKFARFPLHILAGLVFFAEIPMMTTLIGGGLILLSQGVIVHFERRAKSRQKKTS